MVRTVRVSVSRNFGVSPPYPIRGSAPVDEEIVDVTRRGAHRESWEGKGRDGSIANGTAESRPNVTVRLLDVLREGVFPFSRCHVVCFCFGG